MKITDLKSRRWALGVVAAGLTLLGVYGVVDPDTLPLWLTLASQILGVGFAVAVPTGTAEKPSDES